MTIKNQIVAVLGFALAIASVLDRAHAQQPAPQPDPRETETPDKKPKPEDVKPVPPVKPAPPVVKPDVKPVPPVVKPDVKPAPPVVKPKVEPEAKPRPQQEKRGSDDSKPAPPEPKKAQEEKVPPPPKPAPENPPAVKPPTPPKVPEKAQEDDVRRRSQQPSEPQKTQEPKPAETTPKSAPVTPPKASDAPPVKSDAGKSAEPVQPTPTPQQPAAKAAPAAAPVTPPAPAAGQPAQAKPAVPLAPAAALPDAPPARGKVLEKSAFQPGFKPSGPAPLQLQDVQKGRTEKVEDGGKRTVIQETDNRIIIKQDNRTIIRHDETQRFAKTATDVRSTRRGDGTTQTVIVQPGGIQIYNIVDSGGRTVRRYRRDERGRDFNIIDNRRFYRNGAIIGVGLVIGAAVLALREPEIRIPRERYIVDYDRASDDDVYGVLTAPPVQRLERSYSLEEVRYSRELRDHMPRLDLDAVTFPSGSWEVSDDQFPRLERVAKIMARILRERPGEVFLVEGHTDAVGSEIDNLTLSDRRAQAVAEILSGVFRVPAENIVTQGYGEQYLKINTRDAERANRRVAVRRITPLMSENR